MCLVVFVFVIAVERESTIRSLGEDSFYAVPETLRPVHATEELDAKFEKGAVEKGHITPRYVIYRPFTRHDSFGGDSIDMKASVTSHSDDGRGVSCINAILFNTCWR